MGKTLEGIDAPLKKWILKQAVFFVSTAPLAQEGHINCSPKGLDTLRITAPNEVIYCDLNGSGVETIAHITENERILIMLCAFKGAPNIVRLHGKAKAIFPNSVEFNALHSLFANRSGVRSIIKITLTRISSSCGYGVPLMEYKEDRTILDDWMERKGEDGLAEYRKKHNATSIDGLKGFPT
jgi:hypothetical protein